MASLDFVTTLTEKLGKQGINYAIITLQRGSAGNKLHIFYDIPDMESIENIAEGSVDLTKILTELAKDYSSGGQNGKNRKKKK